jgi:siroheme synthase (precorrin-2 oxidase/ferrochelatase)
MFPIALDLAKIPILLIGEGEAFEKRHAQLLEYGATKISLCHASEGWHPVIAINNIIMIAGLPREESEKISAAARTAGKLVNVEDMNDLCDFYFTANVKRGDLLIAVSTGGASPTLSRKIRDYIAAKFGAEWKERTEEIKKFRSKLKTEGKNTSQILQESNDFLLKKKWFCHSEQSEESLQINNKISHCVRDDTLERLQ